jgi:predicted adenine nucleotide alpha hydrolase (AANH) superfamily ATPase
MKVLLHTCCGVCAAGAVKALTDEGHEIIGYFFNPNIHPEAEYYRRLEAVQKVAQKLNFKLIESPYHPDEWLKQTQLFADEPEGGKRCPMCFEFRLKQTFLDLQKYGADSFTTTLTIGPQKAALTINRIGIEIGGEKFLARDFKKKDGFKNAMVMAKQWLLYRQNYCGCTYSLTDKNKFGTC